MMLRGRAHRFQPNDDINTDYIISGRYKFTIDDMSELARHVMEDISPGFAGSVVPGDFIVAGRNFGCGSSREQAPRALIAAGVSAVIAKSYARIFYRSSFNVGLPLVEMDTDWIADGAELTLDLSEGTVKEGLSSVIRPIRPLPTGMRTLLDDGGLVPHVLKNGGFRL